MQKASYQSWLPPRFQRKAKGRQCGIGSETLWAAFHSMMHEAVRAKLKLQWKPKKDKDTRNMEDLPRKASGNEQSQPK
jgi:hypothetical protein